VKRVAAVALCAALQADAPPGLTVATGDDAPGSGWAGGWHVKLAGTPRGPRLLTGDLVDAARVRAAWDEYVDHGDPAGCGGSPPCSSSPHRTSPAAHAPVGTGTSAQPATNRPGDVMRRLHWPDVPATDRERSCRTSSMVHGE
jgi:hypothetical protein